MKRPGLFERLRHAVAYALTAKQPPNPDEDAWNVYWLTLGKTAGDMAAAADARDLVSSGGAR